MWFSKMARKFVSILVLGLCNIAIIKSVNPATTIIGGITNVATSATNFRKFSYVLHFLSTILPLLSHYTQQEICNT